MAARALVWAWSIAARVDDAGRESGYKGDVMAAVQCLGKRSTVKQESHEAANRCRKAGRSWRGA